MLEEFVRVFQLPPAMVPHIDYVVTEQEMKLVVGLGEQTMTVQQIAEMMNLAREDAEELVAQAYQRSVIKKGPGRGPYARDEEPPDGPTTYSASVFYRRLDPLAMFEDWGDVPVEARNAVIEWQLQEFIDAWQPAVEQITKAPDAPAQIPNRDFLLLKEALEQVEAATERAVIPCDCRAIVKACNRPLEVCIHFDEMARIVLERGHGRSVSEEELKAIVIDADRAGLMHTGHKEWQAHGLIGFCNCCACDCYPIRAATKLGIDKQWPRSHYIAARDLARCTHCGLCAKRCHFDAFHRDGSSIEVDGKTRKAVQFDPEKCWGCGLCANTCPSDAIPMKSLQE